MEKGKVEKPNAPEISDTGVRFYEGETMYLRHRRPPNLIRWVIKNSDGRIKTERQAINAILAFIGVILLVMAFFLFSAFTGPSKVPPGFQGGTLEPPLRPVEDT